MFSLPPDSYKELKFVCSVRDTKCNVVEVTQTDNQGNVDAQIKVKVFVDIKVSSFYNTVTFKKVFSLMKTISLYAPHGAEVTCQVKDASCKCDPIHKDNLRCTVDLTIISK